MSHLKISLGIFVALAASRFVPHPPNFTSLLALSFYIPALIGRKHIPALIISFIITDLFIGFHSLALFTWGSVLFIGLLSQYFISNLKRRIGGALIGACLFYIITNFGVWAISGMYEKNFSGLIQSYFMAIPFFILTGIDFLTFLSTNFLNVFTDGP